MTWLGSKTNSKRVSCTGWQEVRDLQRRGQGSVEEKENFALPFKVLLAGLRIALYKRIKREKKHNYI